MTLSLNKLLGHSLGERMISYSDRDAILYALSVGATTDQLDLVYEDVIRVLPCYAAALGLWAVEATGSLGAYDRKRSLHASQKIVMHSPMPTEGPIRSEARVSAVWDKEKATLVDIEVASDIFTANYGIFLPGVGGWGGERGPAASKSQQQPADEQVDLNWSKSFTTGKDQATLYRLTGDRHPIHIDQSVAVANGFDRPILHGLCSLGIAARVLAAAADSHPANLKELDSRLAAPVFPGDTISTRAGKAKDGSLRFESSVGDSVVLTAGSARFDDQSH